MKKLLTHLASLSIIYFARPDSTHILVRMFIPVRKELGRQLAREKPVKADVVVPIPDSGISAAMGYAEELGIPYEMGLVRNHYVGRTFIEPQQSIRHFGVKIKLNPVRDVLHDKKVVVVDDSIVRGTTSRKIVQMIRKDRCQRGSHENKRTTYQISMFLWHRYTKQT